MKKIILIFLLFNSLSLASEKLVHISKSITIENSIESVFEIVSNTMNDHLWRSEVNDMQADGDFEIGTIFTEDARIGLRKNFITRTQLLELVDNTYSYYETPKDAKYFLSSRREVKKLSENSTKVTYTVIFDPAMSKETTGFNLSTGVLRVSYGVIIKKYLRNLRRYLSK